MPCFASLRYVMSCHAMPCHVLQCSAVHRRNSAAQAVAHKYIRIHKSIAQQAKGETKHSPSEQHSVPEARQRNASKQAPANDIALANMRGATARLPQQQARSIAFTALRGRDRVRAESSSEKLPRLLDVDRRPHPPPSSRGAGVKQPICTSRVYQAPSGARPAVPTSLKHGDSVCTRFFFLPSNEGAEASPHFTPDDGGGPVQISAAGGAQEPEY
jgi:hypothetical protein